MAEIRFGDKFRRLRKKRGEGIKALANHLHVSYTYLSKIENNRVTPSEEFIERVAQVFNYDAEELKVLAGKVPDDIKRILMENPREAVDYLRSRFGGEDK